MGDTPKRSIPARDKKWHGKHRFMLLTSFWPSGSWMPNRNPFVERVSNPPPQARFSLTLIRPKPYGGFAGATVGEHRFSEPAQQPLRSVLYERSSPGAHKGARSNRSRLVPHAEDAAEPTFGNKAEDGSEHSSLEFRSQRCVALEQDAPTNRHHRVPARHERPGSGTPIPAGGVRALNVRRLRATPDRL